MQYRHGFQLIGSNPALPTKTLQAIAAFFLCQHEPKFSFWRIYYQDYNYLSKLFLEKKSPPLIKREGTFEFSFCRFLFQHKAHAYICGYRDFSLSESFTSAGTFVHCHWFHSCIDGLRLVILRVVGYSHSPSHFLP